MPLEPVYTAKALWALRDAVGKGSLRSGSRVVFVHTGGLQGWRAGR
jgi:1-aminocyclopropane-1-carboxylate deaminase